MACIYRVWHSTRILCVAISIWAAIISAHAQSPFPSGKQSLLLSNAQSGASERWAAIFFPSTATANYRLILPNVAPTVGQLMNVASISGSDYTMQWSGMNSLAWTLTGNSGTNATTNFIGTTDAQDLAFRVNNTQRLTLKQSSGFLDLNQTNQNTMIGYQVANASPTGGANTGIGYQSLYNLTTGGGNVALGFVSLSQNQTGSHNTAIGNVALNGILGSYNTGVGSFAGYSMTGNRNTVVGYYAGFLHSSGDRNIFIGDSSRHPSGTTGSNLMSIGNAIYGNGINTTNPSIGIGAVSFASDVTLDVRGHTAISNADNSAKELRLYEPSSSGLNYSALRAGVQTANITYTLPTTAPTAGQVLSSDASGNMSWTSAGGGVSGSGTSTRVAFWSGTSSLSSSSNLFWDNTNNRLGIGTSAPPVALSIVNDGGGSGVVDDAAIYSYGTTRNPSFIVASARGTFASPANLQNGDMMGSYSFYGRANGATAGALTELQSYYRGDGTTNLSNLAFLTGSTQRAILDEFGNFGIGTSSPLARLHTLGSSSYAGLIMETGNNGIITQKFIEGSGLTGPGVELRYDGTPNQLEINDNSTGVNIATFMRTGNVGIGTNTPSYKLDVTGGDFEVTNNNSYLRTWGETDLEYDGGGDGIYSIKHNNTVSGTRTQFINSSSTINLTIRHDQNRVGVMTTSPDQVFSVNGNASKTGGSSWSTFSDERVKSDIHPFTDGLSVLRKIEPIWYRYKSGFGINDTTKPVVGVIAQQMEKIAPYTIDTVESLGFKDLRTYNDNSLTYIIINSMKELDKKIDLLQQQSSNSLPSDYAASSKSNIAVNTSKTMFKKSDESVSQVGLIQDDDDLHMTIGVGEVWEIEYQIHIKGGSSGVRFAIGAPDGASLALLCSGTVSNGTMYTEEIIQSNMLSTASFAADSKGGFVTIKGLVHNTQHSGMIQLKWMNASPIPDKTATIRALSTMKAVRLQ